MIKAVNIHKSFNNVRILKGVSISIEKSEIVSIVGSSGAGKSTLLHILGTLDKPTDRKLNNSLLYIKDTAIYKLNDTDLSNFRNKEISFIFQFHQLLPEFTALENICIPAFIGNRNKAETKEKAMELLDFFGLTNRANHKPTELSGGEQQRISVARALINNPSVIFADEPSGNLDTLNANQLHKLFFSIREKYQTTFVIVTHNESLANMADKKYTMKDGVII